MAAAMCSVEPREPPPHLTLPGSFFNWSITSFIVLNGELAGSTNTLYSLVRRASGVAALRVTGGLPVMMPPSITCAHHHHGVRVTLAAVDKLGQAQGPGGATLVVKGHGVGHLGILQCLAQRAAGGVPAAAGIGGDHHLDVGGRQGRKRQAAGDGKGCHGFEKSVATHGYLLSTG